MHFDVSSSWLGVFEAGVVEAHAQSTDNGLVDDAGDVWVFQAEAGLKLNDAADVFVAHDSVDGAHEPRAVEALQDLSGDGEGHALFDGEAGVAVVNVAVAPAVLAGDAAHADVAVGEDLEVAPRRLGAAAEVVDDVGDVDASASYSDELEQLKLRGDARVFGHQRTPSAAYVR